MVQRESCQRTFACLYSFDMTLPMTPTRCCRPYPTGTGASDEGGDAVGGKQEGTRSTLYWGNDTDVLQNLDWQLPPLPPLCPAPHLEDLADVGAGLRHSRQHALERRARLQHPALHVHRKAEGKQAVKALRIHPQHARTDSWRRLWGRGSDGLLLCLCVSESLSAVPLWRLYCTWCGCSCLLSSVWLLAGLVVVDQGDTARLQGGSSKNRPMLSRQRCSKGSKPGQWELLRPCVSISVLTDQPLVILFSRPNSRA